MIFSVAQIVNYYWDHESVYGKTIECGGMICEREMSLAGDGKHCTYRYSGDTKQFCIVHIKEMNVSISYSTCVKSTLQNGVPVFDLTNQTCVQCSWPFVPCYYTCARNMLLKSKGKGPCHRIESALSYISFVFVHSAIYTRYGLVPLRHKPVFRRNRWTDHCGFRLIREFGCLQK